jgi:hypothetical protein
MKAGEVSALREHGLRRVGGAEPQIEVVAPWTDAHPNNRKPEKENRHHADLSTQNPAGVEPKASRKP